MACDYLINSVTTSSPTSPQPVDDSPAGLRVRWATLIAEYEAFQEALRVCVRQPYWPGVRPYISMLQTEARQVDRLDGYPDGQIIIREEAWRGEHRLAATTLAAKEAMWRIIKTCRGVLALERRFLKPVPDASTEAAASSWALAQARKKTRYSVAGGIGRGSRTEGVFVNAVVDNGREWLRVLTTTRAQLLMELAENGWEWADHEGDDAADAEEDGDDLAALQDLAGVSLVGMALDLIEAAQANRYKGAYPQICFLLTRIEESDNGESATANTENDEQRRESAEISRFLGGVRRGLSAHTAQLPLDLDSQGLQVSIHSARAPRTTAQPPADLAVALERLLPEVADRLTPTVNIDTSILIALSSDITHASVTMQDWYPAQRVEEIRREAQAPGEVLRTLLQNALRGRRLVCTQEAAAAFRIMVHDMAQPSEQARARLLLGRDEDNDGDKDRDTRVRQFRALSSYPDAVPDDLLLPVVVDDAPWSFERIERLSLATSEDDASSGLHLPRAAQRVAQEMTQFHPTLSVFFSGWAAGHTTITTNLAARNRIARLLEQHRTSSHEQGPLVWVCRTARSLNGTNPSEGRRRTPRRRHSAREEREEEA